MTTVLLPASCTTSATYTAHPQSRADTGPGRGRTTTPGGGGAGEEDRPLSGALRREPLGVIDRNMSQRRQAKVVVDYNEAGTGKKAAGAKAKGGGVNGSATGKRKAVDYEEDIEGFQFSRATQSKKPRSPRLPVNDRETVQEPIGEDSTTPPPQPTQKQRGKGRPAKNATSKQKSMVTPNGKSTENTSEQRRLKRLADDASTTPVERRNRSRRKLSDDSEPAQTNVPKRRGQNVSETPPRSPVDDNEDAVETQHAGTKIALPLADTPVIRKNKEMRQEKRKKGGERRSSLGMRGRRASSLIETGASNALPHDAVDTSDFFKHIEGEGLPEPRRMKQLLTWCATRALGEKPSGSRSEDESARLAARVIQEELLKDLGNRSELSDWFGREETTPPPVVVKKPHPKNIQNEDKIKQLEEHIQKLQAERQSLSALLKTPSIPHTTPPPPSNEQQPSKKASSAPKRLGPESIDSSLLDPSQQALVATLTGASSSPNKQPSSQLPRPRNRTKAETSTQPTTEPSTEPSTSTPIPDISSHLSSLSLTPFLDSMATGIHDIELFRRSADSLASSILGICARRLEERDLGSRAGSTEEEDEDGPSNDDEDAERKSIKQRETRREQEDLSVVLGALSRLERR